MTSLSRGIHDRSYHRFADIRLIRCGRPIRWRGIPSRHATVPVERGLSKFLEQKIECFFLVLGVCFLPSCILAFEYVVARLSCLDRARCAAPTCKSIGERQDAAFIGPVRRFLHRYAEWGWQKCSRSRCSVTNTSVDTYVNDTWQLRNSVRIY